MENQEKGIEINDNINIEITEDYSITKEETDELFKLLEKGDNRTGCKIINGKKFARICLDNFDDQLTEVNNRFRIIIGNLI